MVSVSIARGKVDRLFATPVITDTVPFADRLNRDLERSILAELDRSPGHKLSNRGGWQSEHNLTDWAGEPAQAIVDHALAVADAHTAGPKLKPSRWRHDAWANVSKAGDFNMPHFHSSTFWAAVYYVAVGSGEGGELVLHDPRLPALAMHAAHLGFKAAGVQGEYRIAPSPGLMVLFPAWLLHSVEPWQGRGQRISIAMNIRARTVVQARETREQVDQ